MRLLRPVQLVRMPSNVSYVPIQNAFLINAAARPPAKIEKIEKNEKNETAGRSSSTRW